MPTIGSKRQVYNGTRKRTAGGLRKSDLTKNQRGRVVSKKASKAAKRTNNLKSYQQILQLW